jgi:hypothetical protein
MTVKVTMGSETKSYSISLEKNYTEYDPTGMTATAGSEQSQTGSEGPAADVLDNDTTTLWHTNWNGCAQSDVWITLDLKSSKPVAMLKYVPRQSGGVNGIITKYRVEVSDDNTNWTTVDEGTWSSDATIKYATFTETNARYVRLTGLESATQTNSLIFGSAAEIRVGYEAE